MRRQVLMFSQLTSTPLPDVLKMRKLEYIRYWLELPEAAEACGVMLLKGLFPNDD